ncbi:MAG: hypothetical protein ACLR8P_18680 [Clostridium fessum]
MLREEGVEIKKLVLGMISGYGRDTMATKGVPVDSIYYDSEPAELVCRVHTVPVHWRRYGAPRGTVKVAGLDAVDQHDPAVCRTAGTGKYAGSRV